MRPRVNGNIAAKRFLIFIFILLGILPACSSLPKIIILHDPLTPEEHLNLGVAYEKKGEFDAAMKEYKAASNKIPAAYGYMGNVCFERNDIKGAEKYYKKAIKKDPGTPDPYNNLAWLYYTEKENMDDALKLAQTAAGMKTAGPSKEALYKDTLEKIRQYLAGNTANDP